MTITVTASPSRGHLFRLFTSIRYFLHPNRSELFPGPMTGNDGGRKPAVTERYRRDHDETLVATVVGERVSVAGPMTDGGLHPAVERYRHSNFRLPDIVHCPSLNAEGRVSDLLDVGALELHAQ